jgi:hypothetical protein
MGRPIARKAKSGEPTHLSVNIDGTLVRALDKEAERLTAERPGPKFTRSDALRVVLHNWAAERAKP